MGVLRIMKSVVDETEHAVAQSRAGHQAAIREQSPLGGEWPAHPDVLREVIDPVTGETKMVPFNEYLLRIGSNNRGGT